LLYWLQMKRYFGPEFFAGNRARLRAQVGGAELIVITANGVMQRGGDEPLPFHQDSNFWYLTGLNGADLTLAMHGAREYLIVPGLSAVREAFDGAHDLAEYATRSGITELLPERAGWQLLREQVRTARKVATLGSPPEHLPVYGIYTLPYRRRLIARLKRMAPGLEVHDIRTDFVTMRSIKQPAELQAIRHSIDITCETLLEVRDRLPHVKYEYELEATISYGFRSRGADGHAFDPIVAAGKHSTTLHHLDNDGTIEPEDLVVVDIGAEVEHYAADVARTISQSPISGRKADVWRAVAEAQDYAFSLIKPGVMPLDYEKDVEKFIGDKLLQLGVIKEASRENIRRHFPHATSHFLGLDTHDTGDYRAPWQAGMVLACEPGIYIPAEQIGVRIEEDVLITETGCEVLSKACPRALTPVQ